MVTPLSLFRDLQSLDRARRRLAVGAAFAGYPLLILGYATLVAPSRLSAAVWAPIAIVLFSTTLLGVLAIYGYGRGRVGDDEPLDERQRAMVDRALLVSYGAVTTVVVLGLAALALYLSFVGPLTISMTDLTPIIVAVALYLPVLPLAALAWIEPDLPADDEPARR
jgi:O-antigen/teichoic acid export membrane protein